MCCITSETDVVVAVASQWWGQLMQGPLLGFIVEALEETKAEQVTYQHTTCVTR
jgi:hypothetical protein